MSNGGGGGEDEIKLAEIILVQGEARLQAQLQLAIAADRRAITMATVLIGFATALFAFAGDRLAGNAPLAIGSSACAAALIIASGLCFKAAWPRVFYVVGTRPELWWKDMDTKKLAGAALIKRGSERYNQRIKKNSIILTDNAKLLRYGGWLACLAPVLGCIAWLIASCKLVTP